MIQVLLETMQKDDRFQCVPPTAQAAKHPRLSLKKLSRTNLGFQLARLFTAQSLKFSKVRSARNLRPKFKFRFCPKVVAIYDSVPASRTERDTAGSNCETKR